MAEHKRTRPYKDAAGRWRAPNGRFIPPPPKRSPSPQTRAKLREAAMRPRDAKGRFLPVPVSERRSTAASKRAGKPGRGIRWKRHPNLTPDVIQKSDGGRYHYHFRFRFPEQMDECKAFLAWLDQERTIEVRDLALWPIKYQAILTYELEDAETGEKREHGFADYAQLTGRSVAERLDFGKFLALKTQSAQNLASALKLESNLTATINVMSLIPLPW